MSELWIDRLTLHVPGVGESEGRRLALEVAAGLAAVVPPAGAADVPALRLDLSAAAGTDTQELARQIVTETLRQLQRLP